MLYIFDCEVLAKNGILKSEKGYKFNLTVGIILFFIVAVVLKAVCNRKYSVWKSGIFHKRMKKKLNNMHS